MIRNKTSAKEGGISAEGRPHLKHRAVASGQAMKLRGVQSMHAWRAEVAGHEVGTSRGFLQGKESNEQGESWIPIISVVDNKGSETEPSQIQVKTQE